MSLIGDRLCLNSITYNMKLNDGTLFYLGKLIKREKGYSRFHEATCLYNNVFKFDFMPESYRCDAMESWNSSNIFSELVHNDLQTK